MTTAHTPHNCLDRCSFLLATLGAAEAQLNCSHGLALGIRYDQPLLLVCDSENRRL